MRLARPPSGPIAFAARWCLLGLGSWVLFSTGAVGLSAHLFCLTGIPFFDEFAFFLRGFFLYSGILYLFVLAMLGGRVANRDRGDHQVGMAFGLTIFLWLPLLAMFGGLSVTKYYRLYSWTEYYRLACPSYTLHWVGADHLGGTIRVLNGSFAALDGTRYKPYGEDRDAGSSLNTDRKFTGQTEDEAAGPAGGDSQAQP